MLRDFLRRQHRENFLASIFLHQDKLQQTHDEINPEVAVIKSNNNLAVSVYTFLRQAKAVDVDLGISAPPLQVAQAPTADNSFLKAIDELLKKDYQQAINDYTQAIKINPQYAEAYYNRGNARLKLKDYQEAINDFSQAIKINPQYAEAYYNRGNARLELKDYQGAINDYTQAIKINPQYRDAYSNRAKARTALGDIEGAKNDSLQADKLFKAMRNKILQDIEERRKQGEERDKQREEIKRQIEEILNNPQA